MNETETRPNPPTRPGIGTRGPVPAKHAEAIAVAFERGRRPTCEKESEAVENADSIGAQTRCSSGTAVGEKIGRGIWRHG